jgi:PTS system galactitol-specific IIC component
LHSVIAGTIVIALALLMATNFAPVHTEMMQGLDQFSTLGSQLSSLDTGGASLKWLFLKLSQLVAPLFN